MTDTPVAFIIFNRPQTTARVLRAIAQARPRQLLIIADGPRPDRPEDAERCAAARAVVARIDWDCQVERIYADTNMGCGYRPASGISRVFEQVEQAIILEDDCVPHPDFFRLCDELLPRYRDDERVMMISGSNPLPRYRPSTRASYFFGLPMQCWGWATWRRAWQRYDMHVRNWPTRRAQGWLHQLLGDERAAAYWQKYYERSFTEAGSPGLHYWDYQWFFTCWDAGGLALFPRTNLVSNIGYGAEATHTTTGISGVYVPSQALTWPLVHPPAPVRDQGFDRARMRRMLAKPPRVLTWLLRLYAHVPVTTRRRIAATVRACIPALRQPDISRAHPE